MANYTINWIYFNEYSVPIELFAFFSMQHILRVRMRCTEKIQNIWTFLHFHIMAMSRDRSHPNNMKGCKSKTDASTLPSGLTEHDLISQQLRHVPVAPRPGNHEGTWTALGVTWRICGTTAKWNPLKLHTRESWKRRAVHSRNPEKALAVEQLGRQPNPERPWPGKGEQLVHQWLSLLNEHSLCTCGALSLHSPK